MEGRENGSDQQAAWESESGRRGAVKGRDAGRAVVSVTMHDRVGPG